MNHEQKQAISDIRHYADQVVSKIAELQGTLRTLYGVQQHIENVQTSSEPQALKNALLRGMLSSQRQLLSEVDRLSSNMKQQMGSMQGALTTLPEDLEEV